MTASGVYDALQVSMNIVSRRENIMHVLWITSLLVILNKVRRSDLIMGNIFHKQKTPLDKILSCVFHLILPLHDLWKCPSYIREDDCELKDTIEKVRTKLKEISKNEYKQVLAQYSKMISSACPTEQVVVGSVFFDRKEDVLSYFNIPDCEKILEYAEKPKEQGMEIETRIMCPSSTIQGIKCSTNNRDFENTSINEISFSSNAQIIVWFHGGGMTLGSEIDVQGYKALTKLSKYWIDHNNLSGIKGSTAPPIVLISVNYRLAPENPFPAAIIDALSVVKQVIENFPNAKIHIGGISAGGNISCVTGMEATRMYPGRVKSVLVDIPMFDPNLLTSSSKKNSTSAGLCPIEYLRWCWSAYLQLEKVKNGQKMNYSNEMAIAESFKQSVWSSIVNSPAFRIVSPMCDLPDLRSKNAPKIIVSTNSADVLQDDGLALVDSLMTNGANCFHSESRGSHSFHWINGDDKLILEEWSKSFMG